MKKDKIKIKPHVNEIEKNNGEIIIYQSFPDLMTVFALFPDVVDSCFPERVDTLLESLTPLQKRFLISLVYKTVNETFTHACHCTQSKYASTQIRIKTI